MPDSRTATPRGGDPRGSGSSRSGSTGAADGDDANGGARGGTADDDDAVGGSGGEDDAEPHEPAATLAGAPAATAAGTLRRDAYFARYVANDDGAAEKADGSTFWGHLAAVASHRLDAAELAELRSPARPVAVVYGAADVVVPPAASRALAAAVDAAVLLEVPGAHFVVDEAEAAVVGVTLDVLRRAAAIHGRGGRRRGLLDLW